MEGTTSSDDKRMRLRYAGTCRVCEAELPAKTEAVYERSSRTVRCLSHASEPAPGSAAEQIVIDPGVPGASARREFERRKAARESRVRSNHPRLGGLIMALSDEPQTTTAWDTGALGEERLGQRLNEPTSNGLRVLHDRRVPKSRANVDHLVVSMTGVHVIDAKRYKGRPRLRIDGGLLRPRVEKLIVGSRDCTKLVDGVLKQVDLVKGIVGDEVPVRGVLCFLEADWPLFGGDFSTSGVDVMWPKKLYQQLTADGPVTTEVVRHTHERLALALPPA